MQDYITACKLCKEKSLSIDDILAISSRVTSKTNSEVSKTHFSGIVPDAYLDTDFEIERLAPNNIRVSHPYINCSELNIATLIKSANYLSQFGDNTNEKLIANVMLEESLLLLKSDGVSPRSLISYIQGLSSSELNVQLFDTRRNHILPFSNIFKNFRDNKLFLADIHDIGHHGIQQVILKDYVRLLGDKYCNTNDPYSKELIEYIHYLSLEYCIVGSSVESMRVYGCLNWQSPKKSPAVLSNYSEVCGKCIVKWNSIRGLLSLKRRDEISYDKFKKSPLQALNIEIDCDFSEEDLWKHYQSNPNKALEYIHVRNNPTSINELTMRSLSALKMNSD